MGFAKLRVVEYIYNKSYINRMVLVMKLKKANAVLGLMSVLCLLVHILYNSIAHIVNYNNPLLAALTAFPFVVMVCIHAVLGMCAVFLMGDGTRLDLYTKMNTRTVVQRVSAALIFPLLIIHLKTHDIMMAAIKTGSTGLLVLIIMSHILFFAAVLLHIVPSVSKGMITLGLITTEKQQKNIDRFCVILGAILFVFMVLTQVRGLVGWFISAGGAA